MASSILAVLVGLVVLLAGTLPWNLLFTANLRFFPVVPWAVPIMAGYLWYYWRYLRRSESAEFGPRANRLPAGSWWRALVAGGLGILALVIALRLVNRLAVLPEQAGPDLAGVPALTAAALLFFSAPVAGVVEEAAFRGYMQAPIERRYGLVPAILITGTMFGVAHLDFTLILWPYYVAVALIYGLVTHLTDSILPAMVLHTLGNVWSNLDLWLRGRAEWQAPAGPAALVWRTGADRGFWLQVGALAAVTAAGAAAFVILARWEVRRRGVRPGWSPRSG